MTKTNLACQWLRTREDTVLIHFFFSFSLCTIFRAITDSHPAEDFNALTEFCNLFADLLCSLQVPVRMVEKCLKILLILRKVSQDTL